MRQRLSRLQPDLASVDHQRPEGMGFRDHPVGSRQSRHWATYLIFRTHCAHFQAGVGSPNIAKHQRAFRRRLVSTLFTQRTIFARLPIHFRYSNLELQSRHLNDLTGRNP